MTYTANDIMPPRFGTDDRDRSDAVVVTWSPAEQAARRLVFEPRATGPTPWERIEQVRTERGTWRTVGSEPVDRIDVEVSNDAD